MASLQERQQNDLLKSLLEKRNPSLLPLLERLGKQTLSTAERELLQSAVADEIAASGIDKSGNINKYGIELDNLISLIAKN